MIEMFQQPPGDNTTDDRRHILADLLMAGRAKFRDMIAQLKEDQLTTKVHHEGEQWTALQVIGHVVEAQRGMLRQIKNLAEGKETGVPADFDIERYNKRQVQKLTEANKTLQDFMTQYETDREELITLLGSIEEAALDNTGRSTHLDTVSTEMVVRRIAEHEAEHSRQIIDAFGFAQRS
jgi:hypothetical protein